MESICLWYVANAPLMKDLPTVCVDKKSYRGKVLRWLEPPIPHLTNPVLVEEYIGDIWTLRTEPMAP